MSCKILLVGPERSGKTTIANRLGGVSNGGPDQDGSLRDQPYHPTAGVRVVEFDVDLNSSGSKRWQGEKRVEVELWDCSGNPKFEACWPAIQRDVDGVLIVYNPENPAHAEVQTWFEWFVEKAKLHPDQCLVFANDRNSGHGDPRGKPPAAFDDLELLYTDAHDIDKMKQAFQDFVGTLGSFKN